MRQQEISTSKLLTVVLTEEQCQYLGAMFRERVKSDEIREKTGYPQDEKGARIAKDLWRAFLGSAPQDDGTANTDEWIIV